MDNLLLKVAWQTHVALTAEKSDAELGSLLARYRAPKRHYHTARHVEWVLRHLFAIADRSTNEINLNVGVAAVFYHDAIYQPTSSDNEILSARLAAASLERLGWQPKPIAHVTAIIEATATHRRSDDLTTAAVLAADLGVLAADPVSYSAYVNQIRREYGHFSDRDWSSGRRTVLQHFLSLDSIYDPRVAPPGWETRARANLTAELAEL